MIVWVVGVETVWVVSGWCCGCGCVGDEWLVLWLWLCG